jgi:serine/threonine protein kinase
MEFLKRWTRKPHHSPPASTSDSEKALEAWKRKFGELQIRLARSDPAPFVPGRRLGGGGAGIVYETQLGGVALALKRTYAQKLSKRILNEIAILGQLSGKRHEHIVQLIGSYIHPQRSGYEIGVLISPVAHCDLACFMLMMDILKSGVQQPCRPGKTESSDETESAAEILSVFWIDNPNPGQTRTSAPDSEALHKISQERLCQSFLCIASSVQFLHRNKIRHKDLKPSQILLSPNGLWLTDFGHSNDMSAFSNTATTDWGTMTYRYQAPERASQGSCSRPEDIFALGCTFLEMSIRRTDSAAKTVDSWKYDTGEKWSFQENLADIDFWVSPLRAAEDGRVQCLAELIRQMMELDSRCRPKVDEVVMSLSQSSFGTEASSAQFGSFFSPYCIPKDEVATTSECSSMTVKDVLAEPSKEEDKSKLEKLEFALKVLNIRRNTVHRLLSDLERAALSNPLITDFNRIRLVEDELAGIKGEEHDLGIMLYRARKKKRG